MTLTEVARTTERAAEDYSCASTMARQSKKDAEEFMTTVFQRISSERAAAETRAKVLTDVISDKSRPASTRSLAEIELDELRESQPAVRDAERKLFHEKIERGRAAAKDMATAKTTLETSVSALKKALDDFKPSTIDQTITSADIAAQLDRTESSFAMREASLNAKS